MSKGVLEGDPMTGDQLVQMFRISLFQVGAGMIPYGLGCSATTIIGAVVMASAVPGMLNYAARQRNV